MTRCQRARCADQAGHRIRSFGAANAFRQGDHAVFPLLAAQPFVDAKREFDILAGEPARKPAELHDEVVTPNRERADAAQHEIAARPPEPVVQKRPCIVEQLKAGQQAISPGQRVSEAVVLGPLADRHVARHADDRRRVAHHQPHAAQQRVRESRRCRCRPCRCNDIAPGSGRN